jgi:hypothetical protein
MAVTRNDLPFSNVPIPDPTVRTTENLRREIEALENRIGIRLDALDKARELSRTTLLHYVDEERSRSAALKELHDQKFVAMQSQLEERKSAYLANMAATKEWASTQIDGLARLSSDRFDGVERQFKEADARSQRTYESATNAVRAAMEAQKELTSTVDRANREAVSKSESATLKQIDGIGTQLRTVAGALTDKIDAINSRLDRGEGIGAGKASDTARNIAIGALVIAALGVGLAYFNSQHINLSSQPRLSAPAITGEPKEAG